MGSSPRRLRLSLQLRLVLVLLVIALAPLAVSAALINQIAEVAQSFSANHAAQLRPPLERARAGFAAQIESKKELFRETARRIAAAATRPEAPALEAQLATAPDLLALEILSPEGRPVASARRPRPGRAGLERFREVELEESLEDGGRLRLVFAADRAIGEDLAAANEALRVSRSIERVRDSLPRSYVVAFLALVGGVVVVVTVFGIALARRLTIRIERLLEATRQVAGGDLDARVELGGRDELAELGRAFNSMVDDLRSDRRQILYLQRVSAWQDVARRLAHEIKNPLTPIQLAMQQVVSSYEGDDERFRGLLTTADEIVTEEIAGLRRLVDAFSALGRLPRVEAVALDLAVVADDLIKDPVFAEHLVLEPPATAVTVSGDRLLLRRLLANLVENAIHAGAGAPVTLRWSGDPSTARASIIVDDAGPGIDPDEAERLFEPYVTSKETGTGLGLAIARKIAIEHGGDLSIDEAPSPAGGARFRLEIPLAT